MKSFLFIFLAVCILAGLLVSVGSLFFLSSDTKAAPVEQATEQKATPVTAR